MALSKSRAGNKSLGISMDASALRNANKQVLNLEETAEFTGFKPNYLYHLTSRKKIPHYKPGGGKRAKLFFRKDELEAWLMQNPSGGENV